MKEFPGKIDMSNPEYWSGHQVEDGCAPVILEYSNGYDPMSDYMAMKSAQAILLDMHRKKLSARGAQFQEGSLFDAGQLPVGTVIEMNREQLRIDRKRGPRFISGIYFGVVLGALYPEERVVYRYPIDALVEGRVLSRGIIEQPDFRVGNVIHSSGMISRINLVSIISVPQEEAR